MSKTNHLSNEASLYLRQHASNPVEWYPWGEEAFARARDEDKPVLISIGYSACHWCHVMERESFEDPNVAALMNQHFINIKVDREERPDVDRVYMDALVTMTGSGGWPLNCFVTPDKKPFYAGTYYPPESKYGRPSWTMVLEQLHEAWQSRRDDIHEAAQELVDVLQTRRQADSDSTLHPSLFSQSFKRWTERLDTTFGGFGPAPKFPNVSTLRAMYAVGDLNPEHHTKALQGVARTLDCMSRGGIYDHLAGGFARYSTDERWLVPHFEKMLYDNAQLVPLLFDTFKRTGEPRYAETALETLLWMARDMTSPSGALYATQDADSEGVEGKFFVWSRKEIAETLDENDVDVFCDVYNVTEEGCWEGHNILHRGLDADDIDRVAREHNVDPAQLRARLRKARKTLLNHRNTTRTHPARDEKHITAWNGLALSAYASAACFSQNQAYPTRLHNCIDALHSAVWNEDSSTLHRIHTTHSDGSVDLVKIEAFADDFIYLSRGLLDAFRATGRPKDLLWARTLADLTLKTFVQDGVVYLTGPQGELPVRKDTTHDEATPSPAGVFCEVLLLLATLTGDTSYREHADTILQAAAHDMHRHAFATPSLLTAFALSHNPPSTFLVIGSPSPERDALTTAARAVALCNDLVVEIDPDNTPDWIDPSLLEGRLDSKKALVYECRAETCQPPTSDPLELGSYRGKKS